MTTHPTQVGDILIDALADRVVERLGARIEDALHALREPVGREALSVVETAEALGVSVNTVDRLVQSKKLHSVTIGTRRLIPMEEVRRVASHGVAADSEATT